MLSSSSKWQDGNICFVQLKIPTLWLLGNVECKVLLIWSDCCRAGRGAINPGQAGSTCTTNVRTIENGPNYGIPCDRADLIMINRGPQIMIHFILWNVFDKNTMLNIVDRCDGGIKMGHWQCYCFINVRPRLWAIIWQDKIDIKAQGFEGRGQVARNTFVTESWIVISGRDWNQVWFVSSSEHLTRARGLPGMTGRKHGAVIDTLRHFLRFK